MKAAGARFTLTAVLAMLLGACDSDEGGVYVNPVDDNDAASLPDALTSSPACSKIATASSSVIGSRSA
jgi:hypothetical protein